MCVSVAACGSIGGDGVFADNGNVPHVGQLGE